MTMFDIIKHCEKERSKCKTDYSRLKTATSDPSITRKMRYSQLSRVSKYVTIRNFNEATAPAKEIIPTHQYPKGQIYVFPVFS